jgi:hypothetical protein
LPFSVGLTPHVLLIAAIRNSPWCRSPAELMAKGISNPQ